MSWLVFGESNYTSPSCCLIIHHERSTSPRFISNNTKEINQPIIIVGNGPSLDLNLTRLKNYSDAFILISCGSALASIHRYGLVPDFHVELERGLDTFERLQQLPEVYLRQINLITPIDQHPKICKLFKTSLLVTLAGQEVNHDLLDDFLTQHHIVLKYAYYTVTNLAVDLALTLGCQTLYLVGIDFGFKNLKSHHSRKSDYFNSHGDEIYDFELAHGAVYQVEANFGGQCLTVPPFDKARKLMSTRIKLAPKQRVFNCNDGAKIEGAI